MDAEAHSIFVWDPIHSQYVLRGVYVSGFVWSKEKPYVPEYNAFDNALDPPEVKICRGCRERGEIPEATVYGIPTKSHPALVHACDGNGCECPMCDIAGAMKQINERQDLLDRWQL